VDHAWTTRHERSLTPHGAANAHPGPRLAITCEDAFRNVLGVKGSWVQIPPSRPRQKAAEPGESPGQRPSLSACRFPGAWWTSPRLGDHVGTNTRQIRGELCLRSRSVRQQEGSAGTSDTTSQAGRPALMCSMVSWSIGVRRIASTRGRRTGIEPGYATGPRATQKVPKPSHKGTTPAVHSSRNSKPAS
jgi:hypothetical protein